MYYGACLLKNLIKKITSSIPSHLKTKRRSYEFKHSALGSHFFLAPRETLKKNNEKKSLHTTSCGLAIARDECAQGQDCTKLKNKCKAK